MSFQYSVAVRNSKLDAVETTIGTSPVLKIFSGGKPANCAAADPSGLLCTIMLPADWLAAAANGAKAKLGNWQAIASDAGLAQSWRIYESTATTCHLQGDDDDITYDNPLVQVGQTVTVTSFNITAGNG